MNFWMVEDTVTAKSNVMVKLDAAAAADLMTFQTANTRVYNAAKKALEDHYVTLPPSGAVTGVYAKTDENRGVWKAPANVPLADVIEPVVKLDTAQQDDLNVDPTSGKSINAIRAFASKGTLIWGARTLDGNSNEWRYIPVRRFFNMVEESVKKSTYWAVFETNDANTWVKVRGMIENYLTQKWREGALAGATTKEAFFVKCGLGTTMTAQDILEGRMNVEIGMAVVRPAEFIILKFSHKLQTS
jgi:phage tail sheath protein FI